MRGNLKINLSLWSFFATHIHNSGEKADVIVRYSQDKKLEHYLKIFCIGIASISAPSLQKHSGSINLKFR